MFVSVRQVVLCACVDVVVGVCVLLMLCCGLVCIGVVVVCVCVI